MARTSKWALVLGMVAALLGVSAGSASADESSSNDSGPGTVIELVLGPGVCC
jgi:hypothetical protein